MRKIKLFLPLLLVFLCGMMLFGTIAAPEQAMQAAEFREAQIPSFDTAPQVSASSETVTLDLTGYSIVPSSSTATTTKSTADFVAAEQLADRVEDITGTRVTVSTSAKQNGIFIGVDGGLCKRAYASIPNDCGWAIQVFGQNIAISGSNTLLAMVATQYFMNTYLANGADAIIEIPTKITYAYQDYITIVQPSKEVIVTKSNSSEKEISYSGGSTNYVPVYDGTLDTDYTYNSAKDPENEYGATNGSYIKATHADGYIAENGYLKNTCSPTESHTLDSNSRIMIDGSVYSLTLTTVTGEPTTTLKVKNGYLYVGSTQTSIAASTTHGYVLEEYSRDTSALSKNYFYYYVKYVCTEHDGHHTDSEGFLLNSLGRRITLPVKDTYTFTVSDGRLKLNNSNLLVNGMGSSFGSGADYLYDLSYVIADKLSVALANTTVNAVPDTTAQSANEIWVGNMSGRDVSVALEGLATNEYRILISDGKIILAGHSLEAQRYAAEMFTKILTGVGTTQKSSTKTDNVTTTTTTTTYKPITLPADFDLICAVDDRWVADTEHPLPDGLTPEKVADVEDGSLLYLYRGTGVSTTAYLAYCKELEDAGYTLLTNTTLSGSTFRTYVHYTKGITLYVSYNAFEGYHNNEYTLDTSTQLGGVLTEDYYAYTDPQIRIVSASLLAVDPPTEELLTPEKSYTKVTDSSISSLDLSLAKDADGNLTSSYGTGFVMMLEDGRFVLIDGGSAGGGTDKGTDPWAQVDNIYGVLADLYQKVNGHDPTTEDPIEIAAWIITHSHGDHYETFWDFASKYGAGATGGSALDPECKGLVTLEYLIANYPSLSETYNSGEPTMGLRNNLNKIKGYFGGFTHINIHTGQTLYISNLIIETLYTHEDLHPQRIVTYNDVSTVMRLTFQNTTAAVGATVSLHSEEQPNTDFTTTTFVSLGDAYIHSARWLCAMYGTDLKSDMVSMAHHGGPGAETALYDLIAPTTVWWSMAKTSVYAEGTTSGSIWNSVTVWDSGYMTSTNWYSRVDQYVAFTLTSVEYIFIADDYNITLWLSGTSGPQYDTLYAAGDTNRNGKFDSVDNATIGYNTYSVPNVAKNTTISADDYANFFNEQAVALRTGRGEG